MLKLHEIKWFYTSNGEAIPYIYNNDETKIKELISGFIIVLPKDLLQIRSLAGRVAITKIYGKDTKFYSSYDLFNEFLNPFQRAIILRSNAFNQTEVAEKQIKLMKQFVEYQIKKQKDQQETSNSFDERNF